MDSSQSNQQNIYGAIMGCTSCNTRTGEQRKRTGTAYSQDPNVHGNGMGSPCHTKRTQKSIL